MHTTRQTVGIKKLDPGARTPTYGSDQAAGADLYAVVAPLYGNVEQFAIVPAGGRKLIKTGIAIELPEGFEAQIRPRSGLALKQGITVLNTPGTIDSDYRGEIGVILFNTTEEDFHVHTGDRIAQMVIAPVVRADFMHTGGVISKTKRGEGGFGSTGVSG